MLQSRIFQPLLKRWFSLQQHTQKQVQSAKDTIFKGGIFAISAVLIIWISIFLYTAFYYAYIPNMSYSRPVHLQFKACEDKGICSYPSAFIQLTKKQQLLMVGQPYKVYLQLEMPESPANRDLGMFMVCAELKSRDGFLIEHSCRSAMLHYRSSLLHTLTTLTYSPMLIFGSFEEKQNIVLELFGNFEEDQSHPLTIIYIEIQSRQIEFYSASVMINAHLSGLRYLMFHWPILSAMVGICTNLFFIVLVCVLSYLHFSTEDDNLDDSFSYEKGNLNEEKDPGFTGDIGSDSSSSIEEVSMLEDSPKSREDLASALPCSTGPSLARSCVEELSLLSDISKTDLGQ